MNDLEQRQQDEVSSLQSIYGDIYKDVTSKGLVWNMKRSPHFQIYLESSEDAARPTIALTLDIEFTPTYPILSPIVKVLHPINLLKNSVNRIERKIKELLVEYRDVEVGFILVSEVKDILDDIQKTTEKVLSLEEERELRLRKEREKLELQEENRNKEREKEMLKQNKELNEQLINMQGDYYNNERESEVRDDLVIDSDTEIMPPNNSEYFIFDNPLIGEIPLTKSKFKFKAVLGFIPYDKRDLLSSIASQYIVKPYLPKLTKERLGRKGGDVLLLLTEVNLFNKYWITETGKREIQELEAELQLIRTLHHENLNRLLGFQIDRLDFEDEKGWKIRLITEFSLNSDSLTDILETADFVNWALARTWLIQMLPALEYLHNSGFIHKLINPLTVSIQESPQSSNKIIKLSYPSYGYRLLKMFESHPDNHNKLGSPGILLSQVPATWMAPELKNKGGEQTYQTDIWDLGVLFMRVMLSVNILVTTFITPELFFADFDVEDYPGVEEYAELVYDLLSKMLQTKPSKRPSPMELNTCKFLRDGPMLNNCQSEFKARSKRLANSSHEHAIADSEEESETEEQPLPAFLERTKALAASNRRRYSNQNHGFGDNMSSSFISAGSPRNLGRYERDFEEIGRLGKGGFGEVVKARSRMEGTFYAIKKIKHKANKLDSLLSEVLSLARLNHQFIVRYYGTWIEEVTEHHKPDDDDKADDDDEDEEEDDSLEIYSEISEEDFLSPFNRSSSFLVSRNNSYQADFYSSNTFDSGIDFSSDSNNEDIDDLIEFARSTDDEAEQTEQEEEEEDSESVNELTTEEGKQSILITKLRKLQAESQKRYILYIQMEFCENNTLQNLIEQGLPQNPKEYWRLFRQLLEAISYIHREGFIHRDLKPTNIFIDKSNNVKVGDFGLAKNSQFSTVFLNNNQVSPPTNEKDLSTIVGTYFYTAKEVASGNYDEKVDMYSLGVIFFEMCYPLGTGMERAQTLNNLRLVTVDFPSNFVDLKYKTERKIIKLLLEHDPKKRPGATEILQSGMLPVEHQDQVIREALKSLADPSSPWQQQVRETLFNQPYSLATDVLFDKRAHHDGKINSSDFMLVDNVLRQVFKLFNRHGAVQDYTSYLPLPMSPLQEGNFVYQVLDKDGSVLTLPYDLVLPMARFLSRNQVFLTKVYRHQYVFRPGLRGSGVPEKYSAVNFDIVTRNASGRIFDDAETLKVVSEIFKVLPCFQSKNSQKVIFINHGDILNAVLSFAYDNISLKDEQRLRILEILSQMGIEKSSEEIRKYLYEQVSVPQTLTKDLLEQFNFSVEPDKARQKLYKLMQDSPHFTKVEKGLSYIREVLNILKKLGNHNTTVVFNPLSNYNSRYYSKGIMFQAIYRVDKNRRFTRVATGGRYDELISYLRSQDSVSSNKNYSVGFSLNTNLIFILMKNIISRKSVEFCKREWTGSRVDVIITSINPAYLKLTGYWILLNLWENDLSCELFFSSPLTELVDVCKDSGAKWVISIKQPNDTMNKRSKNKFKPLRIKDLVNDQEYDVEYNELVEKMKQMSTQEVLEQLQLQQSQSEPPVSNAFDDSEVSSTIEVDQRIVEISHDAPRGRKQQAKHTGWDSKDAGINMAKTIATSPVIEVDARDEVLDMIAITSIHQKDEWIRKIVYSRQNFSKSYAENIHHALVKEYTKGHKWAIVHSPRSGKTIIVSLGFMK